MTILVIDTAFEQCQVGLWRDNVCLYADSVVGGGQHDRVLAGMVEKALTQTQVTITDLDRLLVTTGPGRFTGLRVGIAFARGLALVNKTPLVGVSTVDALTYEMARIESDARHRAVVVSVKRGESFIQRLTPVPMPLTRVMDEDFAAFFPPNETVLLAGVVSPELIEVIENNHNISVVAGLESPSLQAIYAVGHGAEPMLPALVRPFYTLSSDSKALNFC